ncbi:MAG: ABC transporter ATP-binding protein [Chloroflexi bacterium]|nr:ABC transporter ATP-binding protein [Chloroflexota bacterium]
MRTSPARMLSVLATYLSGLRGPVALLAALLVGGTAMQLVGPLIVRAFIDGALAGDAARRLLFLAALFIGATVAGQAFAVGAAYLSEHVGWTATNRLRADLVAHCLRLDLPFHHGHSPGTMIERIDGDVTALSNFFSQFVIRILGGLLLLAGVVVLLLREEWRVGAALGAFSLVSTIVLTRARGFAVRSVNDEREAAADLYGFVEERLGAVDDIRANGAGGYVMRRSYDHGRRLVFAARRAQVMSASVWSLATVLFALAYVVVLGVGALLLQAGSITIGTVYLFFQYTQILRRPLEQIADQLKDLQRAGAALGRVHELMTTASRIEGGAAAPAAAGGARVEFAHVSFAYDLAEPVLTDVDLALAPGEVLGVLGRTGGGKSTLARLLVRFYDPTAGAIRVDGLDLRDWPLDALRHRVGVVTQEVQLVAGTVRENLTLFDAAIPDGRIFEALETLGLGGWLRSLPLGLDTPLGSGGEGLSAGEAQLVAFARIFLRDPGLVILDEASSRLDPATERLTDVAVSRLLTGRTGIVIAHRLHSVERADRLLVLEHGRVAELGAPAALATDPASRYAGLRRAARGVAAG